MKYRIEYRIVRMKDKTFRVQHLINPRTSVLTQAKEMWAFTQTGGEPGRGIVNFEIQAEAQDWIDNAEEDSNTIDKIL